MSRTGGFCTIKSGQLLHGPQALVMYDVLAPDTKQYRGSILLNFGVDCTPRVGCVDDTRVGRLVLDGAGRLKGQVRIQGGTPKYLGVAFDLWRSSIPIGAKPTGSDDEDGDGDR